MILSSSLAVVLARVVTSAPPRMAPVMGVSPAGMALGVTVHARPVTMEMAAAISARAAGAMNPVSQ